MYRPHVILQRAISNCHSSIGVFRVRLQSSGLEQILVVLLPCCFLLLRGQPWTRLVEASMLVDERKLLYNVVMKPTLSAESRMRGENQHVPTG